MSSTLIDQPTAPHRPMAAVVCFLLGTMLTAACVQSVFNDRDIAANVVSTELWRTVVMTWGATAAEVANGRCDLPYWRVLQPVVLVAILGLAFGTAWNVRRSRGSVSRLAVACAFRGGLWWLLPGAWEVLHFIAATAGWPCGLSLLYSSLPLWFAVAIAGWIATLFSVFPSTPPSKAATRMWSALLCVGVMCITYVVVFTWMNWQLYHGLHVPHGDSAMYEEHLWNLSHGKGFRSYLDDGRLFLGEHVQVIHLALLPTHCVWPSHLLLELCESLALAAGAIAVFLLARRHTESHGPAVCLAAAYLLAFPLHFLDIAIDMKTFRPTSFGVPLMLFALDQMERRRYRTMGLLLLLAIMSKEDYSVIVSLLGVWLAVDAWRNAKTDATQKRRKWIGIGLAIFGAVYLLAVMKFVIPAFRGGEPHYFRYFGELGNSPGDVLGKMWSEPGLVFGKLLSQRSLLYTLLLLVPVGFLPLLSPGRLATAVPLFGVLCLLELTSDPAEQGSVLLIPVHHFHAPLIPILFWAAAAGLGNLANRPFSRLRVSTEWAARFGFGCALVSGMFLSFHPVGLPFWDDGSDKYWKKRYVPDERAAKFEAVRRLIPDDARVFSTDFVHTRLTHCRRSYDYSAFVRKSDDELTNPVSGETYYIVIDTHARYSRIHSPKDVPELRDHPQDWELIHHNAEKFFIVLKRRQP